MSLPVDDVGDPVAPSVQTLSNYVFDTIPTYKAVTACAYCLKVLDAI